MVQCEVPMQAQIKPHLSPCSDADRRQGNLRQRCWNPDLAWHSWDLDSDIQVQPYVQ